MDRWEIEKKTAIKAIKDPAFRKKLQTDPKKAIREIDKTFTNEDIHIKVVEEKTNEWILSIPPSIQDIDRLSEHDIEKLVGGTYVPPQDSDQYNLC